MAKNNIQQFIDDLVRADTAAKMMKVRRQTIYYHIRAGNLRQVEIDGVTFVFKSQIENFQIDVAKVRRMRTKPTPQD